uniref:Profilin n=1 Tax=Plectus sambesii TaxID=2011161 RepID=A0A914XLK1_9BILA
MLLVAPKAPFSMSQLLPNVINNESDLVLLSKLFDIETRLAECSVHIGHLLAACQEIDRAAIVLTDVNIWTWSAPRAKFSFRATSKEMSQLVTLMEALPEITKTDCRLEGTKYNVQMAGEDCIIGKKNRSAVIVIKVDRIVLIACYKDGNDESVIEAVKKGAASIKQKENIQRIF